jgi:hypothetical protein
MKMMMMMKRVSLAILAASSAVSASPLVVWKSREGRSLQQSAGKGVVHSSTEVKVSDLLGEVLRSEVLPSNDASLAGVVFVLGRSQDGEESFSKLAARGDLPQVAQKYEQADRMHYSVSGIDSVATIVKLADTADANLRAVDVTLREFSNRMAHLGEPVGEMEVNASGPITSKTEGKRARALSRANVLVVKVDASSTDPAEIDAAVVLAIESQAVNTVILTGARSLDEVKYERELYNRRRLEKQKEAGEAMFGKMGNNERRRLEDVNNNNNGADDALSANNENAGIYYVSMTPNIFAGLLFFFMFVTTTYIAISCMDMIVGQDVYVSKMPTIGREA